MLRSLVGSEMCIRDSKNGNQPEVFFGRATTVFVRFSHPKFGDEAGVLNAFDKREIVVKLNKCVEAMTKLAKANGGALQYMQGCMALISFNAASRVAAHESKACTFIDTLGDEIKKLPNMLMQASVVTSNVLSFFAGNKGQLVLTVLGGYMHHHTSLHHYIQEVAPTLSITLMTSSVVTTVESFFKCRLIGGVRCQVLRRADDVPASSSAMRGSPESGGSLGIVDDLVSAAPTDTIVLSIFQLISSIDVDGGEEWLYNVDANKNDVYDVVVQLGLTNRTTEALLAMPSHNVDTPSHKHDGAEDYFLHQCVIDRLEKVKSNLLHDFVVTSRPVRLW
eukprot:TRINITY_DN14235_c0_g1_i7.p1 TRINITY_DN14235_c0_g1~~TRINITY_DN14235_c0_g1_i7.p1  ORF type:complete len:335 (-),score=73.31 TRINITY_DN14235_c0_g1_i7:635-1639(-)